MTHRSILKVYVLQGRLFIRLVQNRNKKKRVRCLTCRTFLHHFLGRIVVTKSRAGLSVLRDLDCAIKSNILASNIIDISDEVPCVAIGKGRVFIINDRTIREAKLRKYGK